MRVRYRLNDGSVVVSEFDSLEYSKYYEQATFYNSYAKNTDEPREIIIKNYNEIYYESLTFYLLEHGYIDLLSYNTTERFRIDSIVVKYCVNIFKEY